MNNLYKSIETAKNGSPIPIFFNDKPMFSKYNPLRDIEIFQNQIKPFSDPTTFFVAGLGTGLHLESLLKKSNTTKVFVLEKDNKIFEFLKNFIPNSEKIILCTLENYESQLINNYIPQIHGNFQYMSINSWILALTDFTDFSEKKLQENILSIIKNISRDIATQSYFGKVWTRNIIHNIKNFSFCYENNMLFSNQEIDITKTLAIVGASPELDSKYNELKENRQQFFIISTDTTFQTMISRGINPDAVATLDGQLHSVKHFMQNIDCNTILIADFCSNSNIVKHFIKNNCKIAFTNTGHPLSSLFDLWLNNNFNTSAIYNVTAGNGTVLQLALDFGLSLGFKKVKTFGAEFAYSYKKAYCKGTYFDHNFNSSSTKLFSTENSYNQLMYKNKLIYVDNIPTTETLYSYKLFYQDYMNDKIKHSNNKNISINKIDNINIFKEFSHWYLEKIHKNEKIIKNSLLPLIAWINKYDKNSDKYTKAINLTKNMLLKLCYEE